MLKRRTEFFKSILLITDFALIALAWVGAYGLRFYTPLIPITKGIPAFTAYLSLLPAVCVAWGIAFQSLDLYRPQQIASHGAEMWDVTRGCLAMTLLIVAISFFFRQFEYSRMVFILFGLVSLFLLTLNRWLFRRGLHRMSARGQNLHHALIIGAGTLGATLAAKLRQHHELGIAVIGFLTRKAEKVGDTLDGIKILGVHNDLPDILAQHAVDQVFITLPYNAYAELPALMALLQEQTVDVRMAPDVLPFMTLQGQAELFDGVPLVTLQATPLYGWNQIAKRVFDIVFSVVILIVSSPLLAFLMIVVRCTSAGPILYRQKRMGYDGRVFEMLKLRTMVYDAEGKGGWTIPNDPRRTTVGVFLRKTSLDELPQFFNVLRGEMSIVGPRPERPEYVEQFRQKVPRYMLRHKIKAGITGWAQIHGLRGDTSIDERIEYDLHYIEHWSPLLDFKIMVLTVVRGFVNKNAY